jgi:putative membrane protein
MWAVWASNAQAQSGPPEHPAMYAPAAAANATRLPSQQQTEWRFLKGAAAAGRFEGEAARLALARSTDPGVKSFAATLINRHASVGNELLHMLQARGMAPPMLANDQRVALNRLAKLKGQKFDRAFVEAVGTRQQQDDLQSYERASLEVREPVLKAWIEKNLPTLRDQVTTAQRIAPLKPKMVKTVVPPPKGRIARNTVASNRYAARAVQGTSYRVE